jgi:hypothetical protein
MEGYSVIEVPISHHPRAALMPAQSPAD